MRLVSVLGWPNVAMTLGGMRLLEKGCFLVPLVFLHNLIKNKGMEYRKTYNSFNEIVRAGVSLSVRYPVPV